MLIFRSVIATPAPVKADNGRGYIGQVLNLTAGGEGATLQRTDIRPCFIVSIDIKSRVP
ncbi:hypothetical protein [Silanimonas sp.]|uniref:hypothetical protein n=1 Tax=Silanimonas sp. TaxID=1929290 RepID=UPI001BC0416C|nr:hypothetical protein [Silanimonas sp.]MBS3895417.1 hypothetical protein [Silanimonas sp.]